MSNVLFKIKAIGFSALAVTLSSLGVYLSTDVDYKVFGPAVGMIASTIIGYAIKEHLPTLVNYLRRKGVDGSVATPAPIQE